MGFLIVIYIKAGYSELGQGGASGCSC